MQAPGWHGKLPSLGDFASRRLGSDFIEVWDGWLAAGLLALREADPANWLDAYLASPSWRFWLGPGALPAGAADGAGAQGWAGVLMPSVDKVGRYYPLTIVLPLGAGPHGAAQMRTLWHWLGRLDELARDALHDDWSVDNLEAELGRMALPELDPPPGPVPELAPPASAWFEAGPGLDAAVLVDAQAQRDWAARWRGCSWWQAVPDEGERRLLLARGLPPAAEFARLFGASPEGGPPAGVATGETMAAARAAAAP